MMPPGWKKQWHRGVRASQSKKLVAFIAAIPVELRVRDKTLHASEVNFLCIHKKLRSKRLAPVLIKEITRLCNLEGVFQAIYTGGIVLPKPVSTCRYYHRAINWQKLYDVGFSPLPPNSKPHFQIRKYAVPERTSTRGLREMQKKDIPAVQDLLTRYLAKYDMAAAFDKHEVEHWLLHNKKDAPEEQVVWTYVVEVRCLFSFGIPPGRLTCYIHSAGRPQEDNRFHLVLLPRILGDQSPKAHKHQGSLPVLLCNREWARLPSGQKCS
jgi:glycylpeptide N-tetradecanoyltransferase